MTCYRVVCVVFRIEIRCRAPRNHSNDNNRTSRLIEGDGSLLASPVWSSRISAKPCVGLKGHEKDEWKKRLTSRRRPTCICVQLTGADR